MADLRLRVHVEIGGQTYTSSIAGSAVVAGIEWFAFSRWSLRNEELRLRGQWVLLEHLLNLRSGSHPTASIVDVVDPVEISG